MAIALLPGSEIFQTRIDNKFRGWVFAGFASRETVEVHYFIESWQKQPFTYKFSAIKGSVIRLPRNGALGDHAYRVIASLPEKNELVVEKLDGSEEEGREAKRVVRT